MAAKALTYVSNNNLVGLVKETSSNNLVEDEELQLSEVERSYISTLANMINDEVLVEKRCDYLKVALPSILDRDYIEVRNIKVEQWNPWDWSVTIDSMTQMKRNDGKPVVMEFFMNIFNRIDTDGGGTVDEDELYIALKSSGIEVARDGLKQMIAVVDENADGEISKEEWQAAIEHYLDINQDSKRDESVRSILGIDKDESETSNDS